MAKERLLGPESTESDEEVTVEMTDVKKARSNRSRRSRGGDDRAARPAEDREPGFRVDDREFGDLIADGEAERRAREARPAAEIVEPEFVPPPEMYQPEGPYQPVASYREPGARDDVVVLDLSSADESGPLDEAAVKRVLRVSRLMPCYDEVVQKVPEMRGRVRMRFVIADDGHVMEATVTHSELRSRTVESCIVRRARAWRFPKSGQKTRFSTHFDFSSR